MKYPHRPAVVAAVCICLMMLTTFPSIADEGIEFIHVDEQRVSMQVENADIRQVLKQLADRGEIKLWISGNLPGQQVSTRFEDLPIKTALRRLLKDISYALVYSDDGASVTGIYVLPTGEAAPAIVELKPQGNIDATRILQQALESAAIPDNIKLGLLNQVNNSNQVPRQELELKGKEALSRLIETIEKNGTAKSESIRGLREAIEKQLNSQ